MSATTEQVVWRFLELLASPGGLSGNWGTLRDNSKWNIGDDTYINGVVLTVDLDFQLGHLLEVVERSTKAVSYIAIVTFHGPKTYTDVVDGEKAERLERWDHDSMWMPSDAGKFFERLVPTEEACTWAVGVIFGMIDAREDARRAAREKEGRR